MFHGAIRGKGQVPKSAIGSSERALGQAAEAVRLVQARPQAARSLATSARAAARRAGDLEAESVSERALGLVAKEQSEIGAAGAHLRTAVRLAERAGRPEREGQARMSLSLVLAHRGDAAGALGEADRAVALLTGDAAAQAQMQRALVLQHMDRFDEALEGYRRALVRFRRSGDRLWETRALCNRGVLHANRGDFTLGHADLLRALDLCDELGFELGAGIVQHNLGYLCARKGDVVAALRWYDGAEARHRVAGVAPPNLQLDRAELLLSVRLVAEARTAAERAVEELARGRMALRLAEARLLLSQAALLDGDVAAARAAAGAARRGFSRQRRPAWAALARYAQLRAEWAAGDRSARTLASALGTAAALAEVGWPAAAMDARVLAARMALELGRVDVAGRELASASRARNRGPVELRARAWHAKALLCLAKGQRAPAVAALRAGMDVLDEHRGTLGATELRAHLSAHGADLAEAGLRLALDGGDPHAVFEWAERWRAGALRSRPLRPPEDPVLADDMAELRRVAQARDEAALSGRATAALLRRQAELEEAVRRRSRAVAGGGAAGAAAPSVAALAAALGDRALVEMVELDGRLRAVVVTADRVVLRSLGPAEEVRAELHAMQFALRRLARGRGERRSLDAAVTAVGYAAGRLDGLLLDPLAADLGDRPLVVVPTGHLHAAPWSLLPSCLGRGVTVTPCAALWHAATSAPAPAAPSPTVLVAGPDVPCGPAEVARLARTYRGATRLAGARATVQAVLGALDGAGLAHVAAHGTFRADNPLFSCLALADGPLTVYDLETLRAAPRTVILSACESGLSGVRPGDELMGLAAAMLGLGTRTLIASVVAVPDEQTAELMVDVHRGLRAGAGPAEALCRAQAATVGGGDPRAIAAAAGFICFGAG